MHLKAATCTNVELYSVNVIDKVDFCIMIINKKRPHRKFGEVY
jgi:hypothetical protein